MEDQCVFIRGFRVKRVLFGIAVIAAEGCRDVKDPQRSPFRRRTFQRNDELRGTPSSLGANSHIGGSSSSLDSIWPPINDENPQLLPYRVSSTTLQSNESLYNASSSSLDTIRPPINRENPQLLPYPSSTTVQSNGSLYNASFMTTPSYDSLIEVPNDIVEVCIPGQDRSL